MRCAYEQTSNPDPRKRYIFLRKSQILDWNLQIFQTVLKNHEPAIVKRHNSLTLFIIYILVTFCIDGCQKIMRFSAAGIQDH